MMLKTFRHKGLKRLFEKDDSSGVRADQVRRIGDVLANLDQARHPSDLALPGYKLHGLRGAYSDEENCSFRAQEIISSSSELV